MVRENLKKARIEAGLTQQQLANELNITLAYYQKLESGSRIGNFEIWDTLEDKFNVHQRKLRELL